jgi:exopolysaccharide/PEP-CTERM locus tyrosine autokinase
MSIVEQTIALLKQTGTRPGATSRSNLSSVETPGAAPPEKNAAAHRAAPSKSITLDRVALRDAGYLPEASEDRRFAEFYRQIKRPLVKSAFAAPVDGRDRRVIMLFSALPGDGKTFTSINLALSIAQERDVSVLLVDADVLKQHVSDIFGLKKELGLLDALSDENVDVESLVIGTSLKGLSILPAGKFAGGTVELFSSNRMSAVVKALLAEDPRRILLFDSPPLLITNEARALVNMAGQVALVVRAGSTPREAVLNAIAMIDERQAGGIVFNQGQIGSNDGYYGYGTYAVDANENTSKR